MFITCNNAFNSLNSITKLNILCLTPKTEVSGNRKIVRYDPCFKGVRRPVRWDRFDLKLCLDIIIFLLSYDTSFLLR